MILKKNKKFHLAWKKILKYLSAFLILFFFILILFNFDFIKINLLKQKIGFNPNINFSQEAINLTLSSPIKNATIYYTKDGATPNESSDKYQNPIEIKESTTLKFVLYKKGKQLGAVQTHDVFINTQHDLAVISLSTDPVNLWDEEIGIYTEKNYAKKGKEWERNGVINFYEEDGTRGFSREVGIRIHGGGTRGLPQKSFRILITNKENNQTLKYPLFPDGKVQNFNSFILRNAGGDWSHTHLRDALMQEIVEDANLTVDLQDYRPAVLYLNGQYWGLYDIRERYDQDYFSNHYGADAKRVNIYYVPHDVGVDRGRIKLDEGKDTGGVELYNKLFDQTKSCQSCTDLNNLQQYLDPINYRDYLITELHFNNFDWPYGNAKLWRYETNAFEPNAPYGLDGRFRWLLFDLDVGFGAGKQSEEDMQRSARANPYQDRLVDDHFPFRNLFYNYSFANEFVNQYADLLNTSFKYENVVAKIDELAGAIDSEMPRQIERWHNKETWPGIINNQENIDKIKSIGSYEEWKNNVELLKVYAYWRPIYMKEHTIKFFNLSGMSNISINTNNPACGSIKVNSIVIDKEQMPWVGEYFNDVRIDVEAISSAGCKFVSWTGDIESDNEKINFLLDANINLIANYK